MSKLPKDVNQFQPAGDRSRCLDARLKNFDFADYKKFDRNFYPIPEDFAFQQYCFGASEMQLDLVKQASSQTMN